MSVAAAPHGALLEIVRERFRPVAGVVAHRVGCEVEVLPVRAEGGAPVPPLEDERGVGTASVLRALAGAHGWVEQDSGYGVPVFRMPDGALVSYEPGGQIEYSSAIHQSHSSLDAALREAFDRIAAAMEREAIHLLARGLDPVNPARDAAMVMDGERYRRQRAHYDRKGRAGGAMMLRTAGLHINLDFGAAPADTWDAANTIAPHLIAMFANSPDDPDASSRTHRSHRAALWRALDPSRTGVSPRGLDAADTYLRFALGAESFLRDLPGEPAQPFALWRAAGATDDDFRRHLTTLFPEVRPRGYLELRSVDALPARWCVVPVAVSSTAIHEEALRAVLLRELPPPSVDRLERAGRLGLADSALSDEIRWLLPRVVDALGEAAGDDGARRVVRRVEEYLDAFTTLARDPGASTAMRVES